MQVVQSFDRKTWKWRLELMSRRGDILPIRPWHCHPINALCFAFLFLVTPWEKVDTWVVVGGVLVIVWLFLTSLLYPYLIEPMPEWHPWSTALAILLSAILAALLTGFVAGAVVEAISVLTLMMAILAFAIGEWCQWGFEWRDMGYYSTREQYCWAFGVGVTGFWLLVWTFAETPGALYYQIPGDLKALGVIGILLMLIGLQIFCTPLRFRRLAPRRCR